MVGKLIFGGEQFGHNLGKLGKQLSFFDFAQFGHMSQGSSFSSVLLDLAGRSFARPPTALLASALRRSTV